MGKIKLLLLVGMTVLLAAATNVAAGVGYKGITGVTLGGAKNGSGNLTGTSNPLKVVVSASGGGFVAAAGIYDTTYWNPATGSTRTDSLNITAADTIEYLVDIKGIVGIRSVRQSGATISLDSTSANFGQFIATSQNPDFDSIATGAGGGGVKVNGKAHVDTLYIYPLGYRGGTVTITALSRKTKKAGGDALLGTYKVTVSGQRAEITNSSITSVAGFDRSADTTTGGNKKGQIRVRWTHPSGGGAEYDVFAFDTSKYAAAFSEKLFDAGEGFRFDSLSVDAIGVGNVVRPSNADGIKITGTTRSVTLNGLNPSGRYIVAIRSTYAAVSNSATSARLGDDRAKWGPTKLVKLIVPADTTVNLEANSNKVTYTTVVGRTYTGLPQNIGRATLVSGLTDLTYGGLDPWDTLYTWKTVAANATGHRGGEVFDSTGKGKERKFNDVGNRNPVDAGQCTTTVVFKNSAHTWVKKTPFRIGPKNLQDAFVNFQGNVTFPYDGTAQRPQVLQVTDKATGIPAERQLLEQGKQWLAAPIGVTISGTDSSGNEDKAFYNNTNVGTATDATGPKVRIQGIGNYTGFASKGFAITKKAIAIDTDLSAVANYEYNGKKTADSSAVTIAFLNDGGQGKSVAVADETAFANNVDDSVWTFTTSVPSADIAAAGTKVTVQVSLGNGSVAKNYTLSATDGKFEKTVVIQKKTALDSSDFKIPGDTIPTNHLYTGLPRGIGAVTFGYTQPSGTATITTLYNGDTAKPVEIGSYELSARINEVAGKVSNYVDGLTLTLGNYEINPPASAVVDSTNLASVTVRSKSAFSLWVAARSPNGGSLSYRWYRNDVLIPGATGARYTPNIDTVNSSAEYFVRIINTVPNVQTPDTLELDKATVSVIEAAKTLKDMTVVTIDDSLIYNGTRQLPSSISVAYAGAPLSENVDYTIVPDNNLNAGSGILYIIGQDAYKDTILANFPIARRKLERDDFFVNLNRTYNAAPQVLTASVTNDPVTSAVRERLGVATFTYNGSATAPTNAGRYAVKVTFAQGTNFTASDSAFTLDSLIVGKKAAVASDFTYTIPTGHAYTGQAQGIGSVAIKGTGSGKLTVLYDFDAALPVAAGTYTVAVEVEGGENYAQGLALLGQYRIASDELLVSEAKIAIESSAFGPVTQEDVGTAAEAVALVEAVIGELDLAGVTPSVKAGTFTAAVAGTEELPAGVAGSFSFAVILEKGNAKDSTISLSLNISATPVSVASNDRVIPGSKGEQAIVAPVIKLTGEFTVGPNPVAKASGKVGFFWQGKTVSDGTLYVFASTGSLVTKITVVDEKGISSDRRSIGAWKLSDAKGRPVAEGSYLVKGVLTVGGEKVKVSTLVNVQ
jgi:hypothetical protein